MKSLEVYDAMIAKCDRIERKGKSMAYTSANGYMFSLVNKEGEIGIRFSKEQQLELIEKLNTTIYKSHNAVMKGYILIPERLYAELDILADYLNQSFDHVMSLPKK